MRHLESGFTSRRPIYAGDGLRCEVRVASIERIGTRELLTTVTSVTSADTVDEMVAEVWSTVVMLEV